jgi:hypothetical protein
MPFPFHKGRQWEEEKERREKSSITASPENVVAEIFFPIWLPERFSIPLFITHVVVHLCLLTTWWLHVGWHPTSLFTQLQLHFQHCIMRELYKICQNSCQIITPENGAERFVKIQENPQHSTWPSPEG